MKLNFINTVLFVLFAFISFSQVPQAMNYQAVVRDGNGQILSNQNVGIRFIVKQGSANGTIVYTETFDTTSNIYGLINLKIGTGTTFDTFSNIDWPNGPFFIETSMDLSGGANYTVMGTSEFITVPYVFHAETADSVLNDQVDDADADPGNELQTLTFLNDTLYLTDGGNVFLGQYGLDNDADSTNEIQTLTFNNDTLFLSNGGTIFLGQYGVDNDADSTNEIQALTFNNDTLYLTDGGTVFLGQYGVDNDADSTNEIQTLTFINDTLFLSNGGTVFLGQYSFDNDADSTNELQTLTFSNDTLFLTDGGTVFLGQYGIDLDPDPMNELQDITFSGTNLTLSSGSTVDLSSLQDGTGSDDQDLTGATLNGTDLEISIENGLSVTVDIGSIDTDTQLTEAQVDTFVANNGYITSPNDADSDPTNELQTLTLSGNTLNLTGTNNSISLPNNSIWNQNGNSIYYNSGSVGVGVTSPQHRLDVLGDIGGENLFMTDYLYHAGDLDTYIGFSGFNDFEVWVGGHNAIEVSDGFGGNGNTYLNSTNIRMPNIPVTNLVASDRIVVADPGGALKTVPTSSFNSIVTVNNANHTSLSIQDNNIINIEEVVDITSNFDLFDFSGLHISGGGINGTGVEQVSIYNNCVIEGVIFSNLEIKAYPNTKFVNCTFNNVNAFGSFDGDVYDGCSFNNCIVLNSNRLSRLNNCSLSNSSIPRIKSLTNCKVFNCNLGNTSNGVIEITTGCYLDESIIYIGSVFSTNETNETQIIGRNIGFNALAVSGNSFKGAKTGTTEIILIDLGSTVSYNVNINGNSFFGESGLNQIVRINGNFSGTFGLINISGNSFIRATNAIISNSTIRTTVNNNSTKNVTNLGVNPIPPFLIVRDNDQF